MTPRAPLPRLLLFLLLAGTVRPTLAQETILEGTLPDTIVVTATRLAADHRHTGRRITIWTARDLEALPVASLDELLRTVGGVEVQSRAGFGVQSDLTMRGSTFNGVLVLIDGARLNDPMTGHFLSDVPVPLSEIARVEVLRGPATALYGPDALGGVIHILTYTGLADAGAGTPRLDGTVAAQGGAHASLALDGAVRYLAPQWTAGAASSLHQTEGETVRDANARPVIGPNGTVRTDFDRQAHSLAYTRRLGRTRLYTRVGMDRRDFNAFRFYTVSPLDFSRETTATYWGHVRLRSLDDGPTRWQVNVALKQHDDEFVFNPDFPASNHTSRLATAHAQASHQLGTRWTLTGGFAAQLRGIDSNNMGTHDDAASGLFSIVRFQPLHDLTLHFGGRLDYDPAYGLEPTPHVSVAYTEPMWTLRANAGRSVRAPNYIERYNNFTQPPQRGRNYGNPDLKPESAWAYEAGIDVYPSEDVSLHATAFQSHTTDLIDFAQQAPGPVPMLADSVLLAQNILQVDTRGLEIDADVRRTVGAHRVRLAATYTYMTSDLVDVAEGTVFKYAAGHARHLLQGNAALTLHDATLGVQALWKEKMDASSYGVVNLHAAYRLPLSQQRLVLSAEVRNLFDEQYTEVLDAPMPGRWWLFGLLVAF